MEEHLAEHLLDERLTDRELEVLRLMMAGNCTHAVADCLLISKETVKAHVKHVFEKLGVANRTEAITIALRRGLIQV